MSSKKTSGKKHCFNCDKKIDKFTLCDDCNKELSDKCWHCSKEKRPDKEVYCEKCQEDLKNVNFLKYTFKETYKDYMSSSDEDDDEEEEEEEEDSK